MAQAQRPAWQLNPVFKLFSSVKLAMLLLAVLIVASIVGTVYESGFDAKIARHYIYQAPWFSLWLVLLATNLACAAFSRMPWRRHHVAFLITHLGIIVLLTGSLVGRFFGVEGTMTLHKGQPPSSALVVDEKVVQVNEGLAPGQFAPAEILNRQPTPERPRHLLTTPGGWRLDVIGASQSLEVAMQPQKLDAGGKPAVRVTLTTAMMAQQFDQWLLADDPQHGTLDMGLARVTLKSGSASPSEKSPASAQPATDKPVEIVEGIFAFAKVENQIARAIQGGGSGVRVRLMDVAPGGGVIVFEYNGQTTRAGLATAKGRRVKIEGTPFDAEVKDYWPDFKITDGKPGTVSDQPNNPAVFVFVRGTAVPVAATAHEQAPAAPGPDANHLTLFVADDGALSYELASRKNGKSAGTLAPGAPLPTGWADWTLTATESIPHAEGRLAARPSGGRVATGRALEGVRVRAMRGGASHEDWVPLGWETMLPSEPPLRLVFGFRQVALPVGLRLLDFEVTRNEGTDSPASFKSTLEVLDMNGASTRGQCWMNNPMSHPAGWLNTWSGLTFKISQASWNPEDLDESTVQILRDPGWCLKWTGSLLLVAGIFMLFYVPQFRRASYGKKAADEHVEANGKPAAASVTSTESSIAL